MIGEAFVAAGKIVYSVWQVLTGDISLLDGLKAIGGAVYDFLATPFRWARDVVVGVWNFISGIFTSIGRLVADAAGHSAPGRVHYVEALAGAAPALVSLVRPGDLVVTLGAGDVTRVGPALAGLLEPQR